MHSAVVVPWFVNVFKLLQINQVDYKMSTKNVYNYKYKTFRDIFGQLHTQE